MNLEILPVIIKNEITPANDLVSLILSSKSCPKINDGDILVISQKVISKLEGRMVHLPTVIPSILALGIAAEYDKDPRHVEVILSETKRIVRMGHKVIIVETNNGFVCANAGVDESNVPEGYVSLLPNNPDHSATKIRNQIQEKTKKNVAVLIADTFGRPFRHGQTNYSIGISGINIIEDYRGTKDNFGRILRVTEIAVVDEICSAAELVMKKTLNCPVALVRNYDFTTSQDNITKMIRNKNEDLFR